MTNFKYTNIKTAKAFWSKNLMIVICFSIILSLIQIPIKPVNAAPNEEIAVINTQEYEQDNNNLEDAMHFYIRHWHTEKNNDTLFQGETTKGTGTKYFVVVEGYIVPNKDTEDRVTNYDFYLVYQDDVKDENGETIHYAGELEKVTDLESAYIKTFDTTNGSIIFNQNSLSESEVFAGLSVSAGHKAVTESTDSFMISYDPEIHLVKAHVFYRKDTEIGSDKVFGLTETGEGDLEQDTQMVYVYSNDYEDHTKNEIVLDDQGNPYKNESDLPEDLIGKVRLAKVYNTSSGLHTDKTANATEDERTFTIDLESWYSQGLTPRVGMILDASGSMAFTSDDPVTMNITDLKDEKVKEVLEAKVGKMDEQVSDNEIFLTAEEVAYFLDSNNADNSPLGVSNYSYFVMLKSGDYAPIGYWDGVNILNKSDIKTGNVKGNIAKTAQGTVLGTLLNEVKGSVEERAGWYYVTHAGNMNEGYSISQVQSAKRLVALYNNATFEDDDFSYKPSGSETIKFYLDGEGNLKCFFSSGTSDQSDHISSFVYYLDDKDYVKTEALQRSLGSFVTELKEASPTSEVSAVRFSTSNIDGDDLKSLVLLDWTSNTEASTQIMNLNKGVNATLDFTTSANNVKQYNYGLTGSTSTRKGLKAYMEYLGSQIDSNQDNEQKYLIIFTDGLDTDYSGTDQSVKNQAISLSKELKEKDYTIITVLLNGGSVSVGGSQYTDAKEFLISLSGSKTESGKDYFFSVDEYRDQYEEMQGETEIELDDADVLTRIFSEEILSQVSNSLEGYTVQDYIDPRFDLVDESGKIWYLDADGNVTVQDGETFEITDAGVVFAADQDMVNAPVLYFDKENQMYFLSWEDQTIPRSKVGAEELSIWKEQITVRAKDDFIGGNTVLTNGHDASMNAVFSTGDKDFSSGTDKADLVEKPSKGFPRTTVSVGSKEGDIQTTQDKFLGEVYEDDITDVIEALAQEENGLYFEYLNRLDKDLTESILEENSEFTVPYYYMKNKTQSNNAGLQEHQYDRLGTLTYTLTQDALTNSVITGTDPIVQSVRVDYALDQETDSERDRAEAVSVLVKDEDYSWNSTYKPTVGANEILRQVSGVQTTNVVSGKIALQLEVSDEAALMLKDSEELRLTAELNYQRSEADEKERIGTFEILYSNQEKQTNAVLSLDKSFIYQSENNELPVGIYSIQVVDTSAPEGFIFKDSKAQEKLTNEEVYEIFGEVEGLMETIDYSAVVDSKEDTIALGMSGSSNYLNERFGLYLVPVIYQEVEDMEPPETEDPETPEEKGISITKEHKTLKDSQYHDSVNWNLNAGETIEYEITVLNNSDESIYNVIVTDPVPKGLVIVDMSDYGQVSGSSVVVESSIDQEKRQVQWSVGSLDSGHSAKFYFNVLVPDVSDDFFWINQAHLTYTTEAESFFTNKEIEDETTDKIHEGVIESVEEFAVQDKAEPTDSRSGLNIPGLTGSNSEHSAFYSVDGINLYSNEVVEHTKVDPTDDKDETFKPEGGETDYVPEDPSDNDLNNGSTGKEELVVTETESTPKEDVNATATTTTASSSKATTVGASPQTGVAGTMILIPVFGLFIGITLLAMTRKKNKNR